MQDHSIFKFADGFRFDLHEMTGTLCQNLPINEGFGTVLAQE
jgi:hypothetical protein